MDHLDISRPVAGAARHHRLRRGPESILALSWQVDREWGQLFTRGRTVVKRIARRSAEASADPSQEPKKAEELPADDKPQSPDANPGLRIADILEAFPFYVLLVDDRHRIVQANGVVREQLGLTPEEAVGAYCPKVVHGCDEPWYACPLEEAAEKGKAVEREVFDRASGRWVRSAIYPTAGLTPDGSRIYFHAVSDITAAKQVEDELRASREQLRELSRFLESVREDERTRLAREMHDELGQTLTALKIDVAWLTRRLSPEQGSLLEKTGSMYELIDGAIQTVKRISTELRPGVLDDLGLADAIEWQAQELGKLTDIEFRFSARPQHLVLDRDRSTAIFRICQEALTNVVRHADATRVSVSLRKGPDHVSLMIKDNGKGVEESQTLDPAAFGLLGMRERARIWGGDVRIEGVPGKGTVVALSIPLTTKGDPGC
jgi:PAS domain S-box-containing protein